MPYNLVGLTYVVSWLLTLNTLAAFNRAEPVA